MKIPVAAAAATAWNIQQKRPAVQAFFLLFSLDGDARGSTSREQKTVFEPIFPPSIHHSCISPKGERWFFRKKIKGCHIGRGGGRGMRALLIRLSPFFRRLITPRCVLITPADDDGARCWVVEEEVFRVLDLLLLRTSSW